MSSPKKTPLYDNGDEPVWFILYGGESEDGRGSSVYKGRTKNAYEAFAFHEKHIHNNPYSTGHVDAVDDNGCLRCSRLLMQAFCEAAAAEAALKEHKQAPKKNKKQNPPGYGAFE